jgi:Putative threonine efflux protein
MEKTLRYELCIAKKYDICSMFQMEVTILDLLVKGFVIGVVVSAPMGPVGVLCIQRTLNKGRWYGFVTGLGASLSDIIYALITGYGMSFVSGFITTNKLYLQLLGSAMLLIFGYYTFRSNPVKAIRPISASKGTYLQNFVTAFFVTLSNPLIIFLFIGLFTRFTFIEPGIMLGEQIFGYFSIFLGAITWWFGITYFVDKVRTRFNLRGLWMINRIIGGIVIVVALVGFISTLIGKSWFEIT